VNNFNAAFALTTICYDMIIEYFKRVIRHLIYRQKKKYLLREINLFTVLRYHL